MTALWTRRLVASHPCWRNADHDLLPSGGSFARAPRMARLMCRLLAVLLLAHVLYGTAPMTSPDDSAPLTPSISRAGRSERLVHGTPRRRCGQS